MPRIVFAAALQRHVNCPPEIVDGTSVREALNDAFSRNPRVRSYILDDQSQLRKHMTIFIDGRMIRDRAGLSEAVRPDSHIYVVQALSGG